MKITCTYREYNTSPEVISPKYKIKIAFNSSYCSMTAAGVSGTTSLWHPVLWSQWKRYLGMSSASIATRKYTRRLVSCRRFPCRTLIALCSSSRTALQGNKLSYLTRIRTRSMPKDCVPSTQRNLFHCCGSCLCVRWWSSACFTILIPVRTDTTCCW